MSNEFITTDAEMIYDEVITTLESGVSEPLYPGDERRMFGEAIVPLFVSMYNAMNDAAQQKMLRHARGEVLDALGERVGVDRLAPTEAETVLRFSVSSPVGETIIIPEGTRATSDSTRYFATTSSAVIEAGGSFVDVEAVSVGGGSEYNGIAVGAISALVDLLPYIDGVSNLTETAGGADAESDDNLRERIRTAPSKLTTAGPIKGYRYWALSADASIVDVVVKSEKETIRRKLPAYEIAGKSYSYSFTGGSDLLVDTLSVYERGVEKDPDAYNATYDDDLLTIEVIDIMDEIEIEIDRTNAGLVKIVPMCENGELPDEEILNKVLAACSADDVRPLTDRVVVEAPTVHEYDIELTYYTTAADASACVQTIEGEGGVIDQYIQWQSAKLGRDIDPDQLRVMMRAPDGENAVGVTRVAITSPVFTELGDTTVARFSGTKTIRHEVIG
jgi:phage-related baseplate assembly protein